MSETPPLAGVLGWPVGHSRSPRLHGHWLARHGVEGHYVPLAVRPEDLAAVLAALPRMGFRGANVTIPHKEAALALASDVTAAAELIGAANTLTFDGDRFHADNTDGYGFLQSLRQGAPGWTAAAGPALVLGAGGAARAILAAMLDDGAPEIRLANRTRARAEALRDHFGPRIVVVDWEGAAEAAAGAETIVNTTSLGMAGEGGEVAFDLDAAPATALVTDIVYVPLVTPFLAAAAARGLATVDGLGMLLHQGAPGFARWFGVTPVVDEDLRRAVLA